MVDVTDRVRLARLIWSSSACRLSGSSLVSRLMSACRFFRLRLAAFFQPVDLCRQPPDLGIQFLDLLFVRGDLFDERVAPLK